MSDMLVRLYEIPPIDTAELQDWERKGLTFRRAIAPEYRVITKWVEQHFSKPWAAEVEVAFSHQPVSCFLAIETGEIVGFACYETTCRNYFGPTGVLESQRGRGLGRTLLLLAMHALRDMGYAYAIIGGVGPERFYEKTVGAQLIEGSKPGIYKGAAERVLKLPYFLVLMKHDSMSDSKPAFRNPWAWVPTLYFTEGIPYVVVMTVSVIMYKRLGISNTELALYTSWLYLPWVIKPLWSPVVDLLKTKRLWIWVMQLVLGAALAGVALTIPTSSFFQYTLAFFWLMAFSSATHDIAADGFYMLGLDQNKQAFFVGIRSTFYRLAMITGQGLIVILAGMLESGTGLAPIEWNISAKPDANTSLQWQSPEQMSVSPGDGETKLLVSAEDLTLTTTTFDPEFVDSLKQFAASWNRDHNFYAGTAVQVEAESDPQGESLWARWVSNPLENLLRTYFGPENTVQSSQQAGSMGWVGLRLSGKPSAGETLVVNLSRLKGDQNLKLIEGSRLEFNEGNWDQFALVVFQADHRLKGAASTRFKATSGNIPLAWSITFFVLAALLIVSFVYHRFVLPYPKTDQANTSGSFWDEFFRTWVLFSRRKKLGLVLAFLLLYRLGESQLVKMASPFLLDGADAGGLP